MIKKLVEQCPFIVLNLSISFNFCARLGFSVINVNLSVKCMKIRKWKTEIISIQHNWSTQCTVDFFHRVIQGVLKPIRLPWKCLNMWNICEYSCLRTTAILFILFYRLVVLLIKYDADAFTNFSKPLNVCPKVIA